MSVPAPPRWLALLALLTPAAFAAGADTALVKAAILVTAFDRLDAGCAGAYTATQRQQVQRWQAGNAVDALRTRLPELRADTALAAQVDGSVQQILKVARSKSPNDCVAAATLIQLPDAQFGRLASAPSAAATEPQPPAAPAPQPDPVPAATLAQIDSFAFATRPTIGVGGFVGLDIYPVVLFKSGELLTDVRGLRFEGGLGAHRQAKPEAWSQWRRSGGKVQVLKKGEWTNLPFTKTYARLPADLRLSGNYRSLSGTGNVALGGQQSVTRVDEYRFSPDGRVARSGAIGSSSQTGDTRVVAHGKTGERTGRYRVDGLLLRISYDDGASEQRVLITDPDKPGGALWLDGQSYVQRRR